MSDPSVSTMAERTETDMVKRSQSHNSMATESNDTFDIEMSEDDDYMDQPQQEKPKTKKQHTKVTKSKTKKTTKRTVKQEDEHYD